MRCSKFVINFGFLSTSTSNISFKAPGYCMFPDWYSKKAPVIQLLLIVLDVKEKGEGRGRLIRERGLSYGNPPGRSPGDLIHTPGHNPHCGTRGEVNGDPLFKFSLRYSIFKQYQFLWIACDVVPGSRLVGASERVEKRRANTKRVCQDKRAGARGDFCPPLPSPPRFFHCRPPIVAITALPTKGLEQDIQGNVNTYALLTKLVRSRWLDIDQVLFLRFYGPRRSRGP